MDKETRVRRLFLLLALAIPISANAQTVQPKDGTLTLPDYRFDDAERLSILRLHYLTLGTPQRDAQGHVTNAVLLMHGTTASGHAFITPDMEQSLYGPGQPLDISHLFLVMPDSIGAGGSSKPSNGLCGRFPHYGYLDQIEANHAVLTHLGVMHERLVLGTSMGGMQTWQWAEHYPGEADALVAVASTAAPVTGRNMLWREMVMRAITSDPHWNDGQPTPQHPPREWSVTAAPLFAIMTQDVGRLQTIIPDRKAASATFDALVTRQISTASPCDVLYQFESSFDYDPRPGLGRITVPFLSVNFADDLLNPPELLHLPTRSNFHEYMVSSEASLYGHDTLNHPAGWSAGLQAFLDIVPGWHGAAVPIPPR